MVLRRVLANGDVSRMISHRLSIMVCVPNYRQYEKPSGPIRDFWVDKREVSCSHRVC